MKIIILGSGGNLGQQLIKVFKDDNEVIAWDRDQVDISDEELIYNKIQDIKPELIINAAAYNAVDKCEESQEEFEIAKKINGLAPGYIAKAALSIGAIFLHYSSDYIFDGTNADGCLETDTPKPVNKYGETKLLGEKEILRFTGNGLKFHIVRTSKLFGPKGGSNLAKDSFFDVMLKLGKEREQLKLVDEETSCFTYTPDLAEVTKKLIFEKLGYGIYHISNATPCTWYEAAQELFKQANININVNPVDSSEFPRPAKRPRYSVLINTKLPQLRSYKDALTEYLGICNKRRVTRNG